MGKKLAIGMTILCAGVIYAVHVDQKEERNRMKKGIERDIERLKTKKLAEKEANSN